MSAFGVAPNFTYGNSGLRILYPDIVRTIDFSMFKNFQVTEGSRLQLRWEVFNLPNTPSFAAPNSTSMDLRPDALLRHQPIRDRCRWR